MSKRILFIVEGKRTEPRFIKKIMSVLGLAEEKEIYSFGTNIHVPDDKVFGDADPEEVDLLLSLKSIADDEDKKILSQSYTDVYLVFDAEVHDPRFDPEHMKELLDRFSDSTEDGKLYLNYPMMESYRHMKSLPDPEYTGSVIRSDDLPRYKRIVGDECCRELRDPNAIDGAKMRAIAFANARKYLFLATGDENSIESYDSCDGRAVFDIQMARLEEKGELFILNTSVLIFVDLNPRRFFSSMNDVDE